MKKMKGIMLAAALLFCFQLQAQNAGGNQQQPAQTTDTHESNQLLGDENESKRKKRDANQDAGSNYRNNEVSGNPNNTTTEEGGNRESEVSDNNTGEGADAAPAVNPHNTNQNVTGQGSPDSVEGTGTQDISSGDAPDGSTGSDPSRSNAPAVIQKTSSASGSPAVLSEDAQGRDGTNTVQRAKPNMAGSETKGLTTDKNVNEDAEIRKGTGSQMQTIIPTGDAEKANSTGQQSNQSQGAGTVQKPSNTNGKEQVAGPATGGETGGNKGVKQSIDSKAENTNNRDVDNEKSNMKNVPATDTGAAPPTKNNLEQQKEKKKWWKRNKDKD